MKDERLFDMRVLVDKLNAWAKEYYTLDSPTVSDETYDAAYDRLLLLEKQTGVILPDSPTHRVGGQILDKFQEHRHLTRLYSLDKAQSFGELKSWYDKIVKDAPSAEFTVELKYDGLTLNLTYDGGKLLTGATRGKGVVGENVTAQAKTIKSAPLSIGFDKLIEIQGEAIMHLSALKKYNDLHADDTIKNARNGAAGAIRNLDPSVTASRNLDVVCYSVGYDGGSGVRSQESLVRFLRDNGFRTSDYFKKVKTFEEIKNCIEEIGASREQLDFLIDGAVVKVNDFSIRENLGFTDKFPRWAIAFKFKAEEVVTTLKSVEWQVGRTGKLTPLGHLEPIELCGATISRATLNNYDDVLRKNLSVNSLVFVRRSNDVIPEVLGLAETTEKSKPILPPEVCPVCGTPLVTKGANLFCPNTYGCEKQIEARLAHFCSKNAFDIEGVSKKTILQLMQIGVSSPIDLYSLTKEKLLALDGFKDKKAQNFINAIEKSKSVRLSSFIYGLGIENVGIVTAREFARVFNSVDDLSAAPRERLIEIDDVGEVVAQNVIDFFDGEYGKALVGGLKAIGINPRFVSEKTDGVFSGKKIVLTGSLTSYTRSAAALEIEKRGGTVATSVTNDVNLVIAGSDAGSKLTKAVEKGIEIWDESAFVDALKN